MPNIIKSRTIYQTPTNDTSVVPVNSFEELPTIGNTTTIYIVNNSDEYIWNGTNYVQINSGSSPTPPAVEPTLYFSNAATTAALPAVGYSAGVLTKSTNGALAVQDGVTLIVGDILLVKDQVAQLQNGLYEVTDLGSVSTPFILTRITDYNETAEVYPSQINVLDGTVNGEKYFLETTVDPIIGTDAIVYETVAAPPSVIQALTFADVHTETVLPNSPAYTDGTNTSFPALNAKYIATTNGAFPTLQGVVPYVKMIVLVKDQADAKKNGDYTLTRVGGASSKWRLKRISYSVPQFYPRLWEVKQGTSKGAIYQQDTMTLANISIGTVGNIVFTRITNLYKVGMPIEIQLACSDESTALTTGTAKITFRTPCAITVTSVRASLTTAQTSGSIFTVDINEAGASILSTQITIDNTELTSTTAATPPVVSNTTLADDASITVDIDQIGDGTAKGLKITILGTRA